MMYVDKAVQFQLVFPMILVDVLMGSVEFFSRGLNQQTIEFMKAILIHGMGRTPLSMCLLAYRLKSAGIEPKLFAYCVTFEHWTGCSDRLRRFIEATSEDNGYIIVTHSLGSVLTRGALPSLTRKPIACFFLAPPTQACAAAQRLALRPWYRLLAGEMGQLLANQVFMDTLPIPECFTKIYAGNAGLTGQLSPFGDEPNDGILMVKETQLPGLESQSIPSLHTFIMNNRKITDDIINVVKKLAKPSEALR